MSGINSMPNPQRFSLAVLTPSGKSTLSEALSVCDNNPFDFGDIFF